MKKYIYSIFLFLLYLHFLIKRFKKEFCISLIIPSTECDFVRYFKSFSHNYRSYSLAYEIIIIVSSVKNTSKLYNIIINYQFSNHNII